MILVNNQLGAQFFIYVYFYSSHVSGSHVPIIRRIIYQCDTCPKHVKVKWSRYRPGVTQRVGRGIALLFHDRSTRRRWVVSSTPRPHFTPWKDPVPIVQEVGWAAGPVRTGGKSRPHRDLIPNRPARNSVAIPTELPSPRPKHVENSNKRTVHEKLCVKLVIYKDCPGCSERKKSVCSPTLHGLNEFNLHGLT